MARKRAQSAPPDPDEDPPLAAPGDNDVDHLMRLLSWGRANGYRIGPMVTVGNVSAQVADIRQARKDLGAEAGEPTVYEEHGITEHDRVVEGTVG